MLFWKKKKTVTSESPRPVIATAYDGDRVQEYFGGVIQVRRTSNRIHMDITEKGRKKLLKMTKPELLLYMNTSIEAHNIETLYNVVGTGPVCSTSDFIAFKTLMQAVGQMMSVEEEAQGESRSSRYELAVKEKV